MTRVADLDGAALDRWVAQALGARLQPGKTPGAAWRVVEGPEGVGKRDIPDDATAFDLLALTWFAPSRNWFDAGPVIERHGLSVCLAAGVGWSAFVMVPGGTVLQQRGPTPLVAAMRCFVASKLGEYLED